MRNHACLNFYQSTFVNLTPNIVFFVDVNNTRLFDQIVGESPQTSRRDTCIDEKDTR